MTPDAAMVAARYAVKHDLLLPPRVVGVLLAELDARGVAIERVRRTCEEQAYVDHSRGYVVLAVEIVQALDGQP
jgi:hypothetical protein